MTSLYFDVTHAVNVQKHIIDVSGGLHGIKDIGQLESILSHIQNDDYYPTFEDKLTHLVFSIIKIHCFTDGNKRSSLALGAYFLEINGLDYAVKGFICELENIVVWVAEGLISKDLLGDCISCLCSGPDISESVKLEIIYATQSN